MNNNEYFFNKYAIEDLNNFGILQNNMMSNINLYQQKEGFEKGNLFPSLYEGLGMVLIEAQSSGLYCITSDEVPIVANVTGNVIFVNLLVYAYDWNCIVNSYLLKKRKVETYKLLNQGYDIKKETIKLEKKYIVAFKEKEIVIYD